MDEGKFSGKKADAIKLLALGTIDRQDIAKLLEISRTTLWQWEKDVEFKAAVDRYEHDLGKFSDLLIKSKTLEAIDGYWNLANKSKNDMVRKGAYEYFIDRSLGKVTNKHEVSTNVETHSLNKDILEEEHEKWLLEMEQEPQ
jgi:hypothetical protein